MSCLFVVTPKDEAPLSTSFVSSVTTNNERRHKVLHEDSKIDLEQKDIESRSHGINQGECTAVVNSTKDVACITLNKDVDSGKQNEKDIDDYVTSASTHIEREDTSKDSPADVKCEADSSSRKSDSSDSGSWIRVLDKESKKCILRIRQLAILVKKIFNNLLSLHYTIAFFKS